jgi:hypothetical protein
MQRPPKYELPPLMLMPDSSVGCDALETTRPEPPLDGVWKASVLSPTVRAYQVLLLHDED